MSTPYLHAAWLSGPDAPDDQVPPATEEYLAALREVPGVVAAAAYRTAAGGPAMQRLAPMMMRTDDEGLRARPPGAFVLAELDSLLTSVAVGERFGAASNGAPAHPAAGQVVSQAVLHEIAYVAGPEDEGHPGFAPAVQFGYLNVKDTQAEWDLNDWYETTRLPATATIPGQVRTRRYVTVCGSAKFGILYEFLSLDARLKGFEELHEAKALDDSHPTSALRRYTVHAPGAPFIGERVA